MARTKKPKVIAWLGGRAFPVAGLSSYDAPSALVGWMHAHSGGGRRVDQTEITASPKLRAIFLVAAIIMFVFWGLSLIPPIKAWGDPNEDGLSYMPAFWATITCLPVGLYLLVGALAGRGRHVARARTALVLGSGLLFLVVGFLIVQRIAES